MKCGWPPRCACSASHVIRVGRRTTDSPSEARHAHPAPGEHRHLPVLQDQDVPSERQQSRDVRGQERLARAESDDDAARAVLGGHDSVRSAGGQHRDRVRAADLTERRPDGRHEVSRTACPVCLDEMREHLGVRLGPEPVATRGEPTLQLGVVLEDAVVHHGDGPSAVGVRVRVLVRRAAMGRPARVAHADGALDGFVRHQRRKRSHLADSAPDREPGAVQDGDAGRVVTPVLDAAEPVQENPASHPIPDIPDDPAHA